MKLMVAFSLFGFDIYWYGIFYLVAFLFVYIFLRFLGGLSLYDKYPRLKLLLSKDAEYILIYAILGVLIGGRLGYVVIYDLQYFIQNPLDIFAVWNGGMAFVGGIIGVILAMLLLRKTYKLTRNELLLLFDSVVAVLPIGIALGRLGNFLNKELYGLVVYNKILLSSPYLKEGAFSLKEGTLYIKDNMYMFLENIGFIYDYGTNIEFSGERRINTNFLAILLEGFVVLCFTLLFTIRRIVKKNMKPGFISGVFLIVYSFVRFWLEYLRHDSQSEFVFFLTKSQRFFVVFILLGIYLVTRRK